MAGIHQQQAGHVDRVGVRVPLLTLALTAALLTAACSAGIGDDRAQQTEDTIRSSGALAYVDPEAVGTDAPGVGNGEGDDQGDDTAGGTGGGPIPTTDPAAPGSPDSQDPDSQDPDLESPDSETSDPEASDFENSDPDLDSSDLDSSDDDGDDAEGASGLAGLPIARPDGITLAFVDGALASIAPRSTMEEISRTLGPLYRVTAEPFIRTGFSGGYSVSQGGEVLLWAIEENGRITTIMTVNPLVGLDSGLRPTMPLVDAVALHGEPALSLGPELREFAAFDDGTGANEGVSVLVDIGQFGGPVGVYAGALEPGMETTEYQQTDAVIKELWFDVG